MALCNLLTVLLLFSLYPFSLQAQISFPLDNITYWSPGSLVKLPWTYNIPKADILAVEILFTKSGTSKVEILAQGAFGANATIKDPTRKFTIEEQATLVFKNANLGHNGTYALGVTLSGGAGQRKSEVKVVILEQPIAKQTCSKQNGKFYCECKSDAGNPPPLAYWSKNGKKIGDFGYKEKNLTIDDITKGEAGIYSCNVKSHNLTDQKNISVEAPKIASFVSKPRKVVPLNTAVTFTCKANGILPTMFNISFNGTDPERIQNGLKTIDKFTKDNVGGYKCIAFNVVGSNFSQELKLNFTEEPTGQPASKTTTNNRQSPTSETTNKPVGTKESSDNSGLGTGPIVGIVIGSLFVVILIAALTYRFICKGSSKSTEREGVPVVSNADGSVAGTLPRANEDNAYECVDQEKLRREAAARNEGNGGDDGGDGSTLPPVYAVVDKTKKKREKKPAPTYASLDPVALQPDSSKMRDRSREETNYASINLDSLQSDLV